MKKTICILAAAVMAVSASALASCGNSGSDDSTADSAAAAQTDVSASASDIADKLKSDITYVDQLNELSAEMVEKLYGISSDKYTDGKVYIGSGGATAEEIACFDAVDESAAEEIKTACETRVSNQIKQFENYVPAELDKLNDPVIVVKGSSVYMCVSDDNSKAEEIIG
jgi:hypothetical protein